MRPFLKSKNIGLIVLLVISFLSHVIWFSPFSKLSFADWGYWPSKVVSNLARDWNTWLSFEGFGSPNIQINFYFFKSIWSSLSSFNIDYDLSVKLTVFIPILIISVVGSHLLSRRLFKRRGISFAISLYYISTTYFLVKQSAHLYIAIAYALLPLLIFLLSRAFQKKDFKDWFFFFFAYNIALFYEIRITLITTVILILYVVLVKLREVIPNLKYILSNGVITLLLNAFWILPTFLGKASADKIAGVANRVLFGNQLFDISHALTLTESSWSGGVPNQDFVSQPIPLYFWIIPIIILIGLISLKKIKHQSKSIYIFFIVISFIGIFLTKQSGEPIPTSYQLLYEELPGFNLFREASKFYMLTAIGFLGLLGFSLQFLDQLSPKFKKLPYYLGIFAIVIVSLLNLKPLLTNEFGSLTTDRKVSEDYEILSNFINNQDSYFRTLWVPSTSRWGEFSTEHPKINGANLPSTSWKTLFSLANVESDVPVGRSIIQLLETDLGRDLVKSAAVKYLIIPLRDNENDDDRFKFYGTDREYYINSLDNLDYIKEVDIGTKELKIYGVENYKSYIYAETNVFSSPIQGDLTNAHNFIENVLKNESPTFGEYDISKNNGNLLSIADIFSSLNIDNLKKGEVTSNSNLANLQTDLYSTNSPRGEYSMSNSMLNIYAYDEYQLNVNNNIPKWDVIYSEQLDESKEYYISNDDSLNEVSRDEQLHNLGVLNNELNILEKSNENLLVKGSFDEGLWNPKVLDCNNYDNSPDISAEIVEEEKSLKMISKRHTACQVSDLIAVEGGSTVLMKLRYKVENGKEAHYRIEFNNGEVIDSYLDAIDERWRDYSILIDVPTTATEFKITLLAPPANKVNEISTIYYDNVSFYRMSEVKKIEISKFYSKDRVSISQMSYLNSNLDFNNLIRNGSLENGLWKEKVEDCNAYDNNAQLEMKLFNEDSTDNSLLLRAKTHTACTSPDNFVVLENSNYLFSFDYKSSNAKYAGYYISFNDPKRTSYGEKILMSGNEWNTYTKLIKVPAGAKQGTITLYSYSDANSNIWTENYYDNVFLSNIPELDNQYYALIGDLNVNKKPKSVTSNSLGTTKKSIDIKGATTPFFLVMSENYNSRWILKSANNDSIIDEKNHYKINHYQNGWYVEPIELCKSNSLTCTKNADGSYDIEMIAEFTPQRYFNVGLIISVATFVVCIDILIYYAMFRKKKNVETIAS